MQEKLLEENYSDGTKALKSWNLYSHFNRKSLAYCICEKAKAKKDKGLYEFLHNLISSNPKEDLNFLKVIIFHLYQFNKHNNNNNKKSI